MQILEFMGHKCNKINLSAENFNYRRPYFSIYSQQHFLFHVSSAAALKSASSPFCRRIRSWLRPEVYPLFAAVGVAVGICGMQLIRNISINPEVRVNKENRAAGVLDNRRPNMLLGSMYETGLQKSCHPLTASSPILSNFDSLKSFRMFLSPELKREIG